MGKSRNGKVKTIKKTLGGGSGDELNNIFSQLLGNKDSLDPCIVLDKYQKLKSELLSICSLLDRFNINILDKLIPTDKIYNEYKEDIEFFIKNCKNEFDITELKVNDIVPIYLRIKDSDSVNKTILLCQNLIQYKQSLSNKHELSDRFIYNEPGNEVILLPFANLNFKFLFRDPEFLNEKNTKMKPFTMVTLHLLYKLSYSVYEIITSPDINIEQFSEIIIKSINEAKKSIPRCDKAFNKISNSLDMLTNNFGNYYKDMILTKKPSIIIENFLSDLVSDTSDSDMECVHQLKKIVDFYKNKTMKSGAIKDPRISQLFETIQEKFSLIDTAEEENNSDSDDGIDVDKKE
jgi:hypothetical protein